MKKTLLLALAAITTGMATGQAQDMAVAEAASFSTTLTPAVVSQYMFRGQRLGGPAFQPNVEVDYGALGVGVWSSFPLADKVDGVSDPEIDPYFYYTLPATGWLNVVPGATLYTFPRADTGAGFYRSTFEPSLALGISVPGGVTLTPKVYYDFVLDGATLEITAAYAVPLTALGSELDLAASYGDYLWHDAVNGAAPAVKQAGQYWTAGATVPFQLTKAAKLTIGFLYTKGYDAYLKEPGVPKVENTLAVGRGVASVSYSHTF